jgi:hypothetical protein
MDMELDYKRVVEDWKIRTVMSKGLIEKDVNE